MPTEQAAAQTGFFRFLKPILGLLILLLVGGSFAYRSIQVSLFPERTFPKIKIIADAGEQPVELMMVAITQPLENTVNQVEGVEMVRSTTSRGSSELSIYLNWGSIWTYRCNASMPASIRFRIRCCPIRSYR